MKISDRNKKAFFLLSTYVVLLTMPKVKAEEAKITFTDNYRIESNMPFATYGNKDLYIGSKQYIEKIKDNSSEDIYIIDDRENTDPNIIVCDSHKIKTMKEITNILNILITYENEYPSDWDRSLKTMKREWLIHNLCHLLKIRIKSAKNVDLNNLDEEIYINYWNIANEIYNELHKENDNNQPHTYIKYKRIK